MASTFRYVICVAMLLAADRAWAPIMGIFPGLPDHISNSQDIVVATVLTDAPLIAMDSFAPQRVRVLSVLKGDLDPQAELTVELRGGLLWPFPTDLSTAEYRPYERYVFFMTRRWGVPARHTLLNVQGSAFWIPRELDVSEMPEGDVRSKIEFLVQEVVAYQRRRSAELEERAREFIRQ